MSRRGLGMPLAVVSALVLSLIALFAPAGASATTLPPGFEQTAILPGVSKPQDVAIAPNGRVFVAEKSGLIRTFDNLDDTTPTLFGDLRTKVQDLMKALQAAEKMPAPAPALSDDDKRRLAAAEQDAKKLAAAEQDVKTLRQEREEVRIRIAKLLEVLEGLE